MILLIFGSGQLPLWHCDPTADVDVALMKQVLDISERQCELDVHHHRQANDLRFRLEVLERVAFLHCRTLRNHPARLKANPSYRADRRVPHGNSRDDRHRDDVSHQKPYCRHALRNSRCSSLDSHHRLVFVDRTQTGAVMRSLPKRRFSVDTTLQSRSTGEKPA